MRRLLFVSFQPTETDSSVPVLLLLPPDPQSGVFRLDLLSLCEPPGIHDGLRFAVSSCNSETT